MKVTPEFPEHRVRDPQRQAELRVYNELVNSPCPGYALYEVKPINSAPEVDFAVWIEGVGCLGMQVKGGQNTVEDAIRWFLNTVEGTEPVPCPIQRTWDAALSIKTAVKRRLGRRMYVIPVLLYPDMLPDPDIQRVVESDARVSLLWGEQDLVKRLTELPATDNVFNPPDAGQIVAEVAAVRNVGDLSPPAGSAAWAEELESFRSEAQPAPNSIRRGMDLTARQVIIQRADVVNVYTVDSTGEPDKSGG